MVKGTKVISATSFVMIMLEKKHRNTSTEESLLTFPAPARSFWPRRVKTPMDWKPPTTAIRQNRRARVL